MVQVRNMPADMHRTLKARAALAGLSLSDYILRELRFVTERPSVEEFRARLATRSRVEHGMNIADILREEREKR